jgi:protein tyrosine/serine phosphatase
MEQIGANLYRGSDPTVREIYALHEKGFKTVISIRTNAEEKKRKLCEKLGMHWVNIKTGVFLLPTDDQFDHFREVINKPENRPCLVSCELGMDRAGVYIAAHRMADENWSEEQMTQEFRMHHQKRWWPVFRKYQKLVVGYAARRQGQYSASAPSMSHQYQSEALAR